MMDEDRIDNYTTPHDLHRETAAEMFGVRPEDVTEDMRKAAKRRNFGKLYGMGPEQIQKLGPPLTEAEAREKLSTMFSPQRGRLATEFERNVERLHRFSRSESRLERPRSQRPKCPRCWNRQPAKRNCGYCGGQGRV